MGNQAKTKSGKAKQKTIARSKAKPKTKAKPRTVDQYLAGLSEDKRAALESLRQDIRAAAPRAQEGISYQIPGFRLDGKWLVWFGAGANHCAMYGVGAGFKNELKDYDTSGKGTIRFTPDNPLPASLVRRLVRALMATNS